MERAELERELERLHTACWGWALACCGRDHDTAEEAPQTAYLKIVSGQTRFDDRSSFRTWAIGVVRRTAMEELRRRRTRHARESGDEIEAGFVADPAPGAAVEAERPRSVRRSSPRSARCRRASGKCCSSCSITA